MAVKKRSIVIDGMDTTIKLEVHYWSFIDTLAKFHGMTWRKLVRHVEPLRPRDINTRVHRQPRRPSNPPID